ncbi:MULTISPECIES: efflux RND transporter periplasmic adaptor subunit [Neisseria]|uniref:HlyD family secretion protein n=1 Tax=Neisseria TaxID=482 RepID=UPI0010722D17|nr:MULTISPECIES: efflux RND transporter periplasmic adaptor subunit [Neisseria]MBF0803283.1 efflux RND transporter periplasmic adaptor subunit [Neisseria sp. 19428wB4_WF04]QNT58936.1 efflux transporter, RND family, MFP subunit [Neisseria musculi]TFU44125.1 HlyD family efflux transporter periplasmic adaptor subunit [Neisseria sp. WF04]
MNTPQHTNGAPGKRRLSRRKRNLTLVTLFFIVVALATAMIYFLVWQHEEKTDDAYVAGHLVQITPQVAGTVRKVLVDDTDTVKKGDVLVSLDDSDFQLAYDRAQNELIQAIRQNRQQTAVSSQAKAQVLARKADLAKAQADLRRRESLAGTDAVSGEELSHARAAVVQAQAALKAVEAEEASAQAVLGKNIPLRQQPAVQTAVSRIKDAWLNLQRTQIRAPMAGQVAKRNVQVGQRIAPGAQMMAVVPMHNLWVDANFKEVQLRKMRIGQPVEMTADLYGSRVVYRGKVMGLSAGTGSAFSLLPPENATGNWIKVVQRVPVRISLSPQQVRAHPLRVGLSMSVKVDTSDAAGKTMAEAGGRSAVAAETDIVDWAAADALIEQIFEKYAK